MKTFNMNLVVLTVILLVTYPMFYFAYKYLDPYLVSHDLDLYLYMYRDFDISKTETPFNSRLISCFLVFMVSKLNIAYGTDIAFKSELIDPNIYFSAFLISYLFFIGTVYVVFKMFYQQTKQTVYAIIFTLLYVLSFGNFLYSLNPLTDSGGYFLGACAVFFYIKKSNWLWLILVLSVIQREYLLLMFGLMAAFDFIKDTEGRKYAMKTFLVSVISFSVYILLRKIYLYTPKYESQLNVTEFLSRAFNSDMKWGSFFKQTIFNQNILLLYFCVIIYKWIKKTGFNLPQFLIIVFLLLQVIFLSVVGNLGNNGGRYFHLITPLIVYFLYQEISRYLPANAERTSSGN